MKEKTLLIMFKANKYRLIRFKRSDLRLTFCFGTDTLNLFE